MSSGQRLNIGTTNTDKIAEVASILAPLDWILKPLPPLDVPETEDTFEGNAILKARAYAAHSGDMTLSEDSGVEVDALDGLPGPWSARFIDCRIELVDGKLAVTGYRSLYEGKPSREEIDRANNARLLSVLGDDPNRTARFVVCLAVAQPDGTLLFCARAEIPGQIATEARGTHGFGYDPIFIGDKSYGNTMAELDSARKNLRSHRRDVLDKFFWWAKDYK